tara:strand:- start:132 stop:431 length:300 start_codon:yes stop_codon:yes gene_type:complete
MKWLFKLERDLDLDMPTAWSGFVNADTKNAAHKAILEKLGVDKMPANTIVATQDDLIAGKTPKKLRRVTAQKPAPKKAFADIGMTFDQAEDLLKKFGLK